MPVPRGLFYQNPQAALQLLGGFSGQPIAQGLGGLGAVLAATLNSGATPALPRLDPRNQATLDFAMANPEVMAALANKPEAAPILMQQAFGAPVVTRPIQDMTWRELQQWGKQQPAGSTDFSRELRRRSTMLKAERAKNPQLFPD